MSAETLQRIRPEWCFLKSKMKRLSGAIFVVMAIQIQQASAQDLVLQDTTIITTTTFSANSITTGPNFTIASTGDVILSAETIAMVPQFVIIQGGNLKVVSGVSPAGVAMEDLIISDEFIVHQNYPNPFNPSTKIKFALPKPEHVTLQVYNTLGQNIETLLNKQLPAGSYNVEYNASNLPSGIYYYRIQSGKFHDVKKMVLLK